MVRTMREQGRRIGGLFLTLALLLQCLAPVAWASASAAVEDLSVIPGYSQVKLSWSAPAEGADSYDVYYQIDEDTWVYRCSVSDTAYVDTEAETGVTYTYRVDAVKDGTSIPGTPVKADLPTGAEAFKEHAVVRYVFRGEDQVFDGSRVLDQTKDLAKIKDLTQGTILLQFRYDSVNVAPGHAAMFTVGGASSEETGGAYYGIISDGTARYSLGAGMHTGAHAEAPITDEQWHTVALSSGAKDVYSALDGDSTSNGSYLDMPKLTGFFSRLKQVAEPVQFSIGGVPSDGTYFSNLTNWSGHIAYLIISDEFLTPEEGAALTAAEQADVPTVVPAPKLSLRGVPPLAGEIGANAGTLVLDAAEEDPADVIIQLAQPSSKNNNDLFALDGMKLTTTQGLTADASYVVDVECGKVGGEVKTFHLKVRCRAVEQPFYAGDSTGTIHYRIPALITLQNGDVMAAIDARFGPSDSPDNLDTAVRIQDGETGEWGNITLPNHFQDYPDVPTGQIRNSASFIDPELVQANSGRIFMLVDAFPYGGGYPSAKAGSGMVEVEGQKYLALTSGDYSDINAFAYYIGADSNVYRISDSQPTAYSVDEEFNLCKDGQLLYTQQYETGKQIPMNIFYAKSELRVFMTSYLWLRYSDDNGQTWSPPTILNELKRENERFWGTGPGRGHVIQKGEYAGRIVLCTYDDVDGERSSVVYSDDNGATWRRGARTSLGDSGLVKTSESQVVELPDGTLRLFTRTAAFNIGYCDSFDGGETWTDMVKDEDLTYCGNNQLSVLNYNGSVDGKPAILISYAMIKGEAPAIRSDGVLRVGVISENPDKVGSTEHYTITWKDPYLYQPGRHDYSCLTQLPNGDIGVLHENLMDSAVAGENVVYRVIERETMGLSLDEPQPPVWYEVSLKNNQPDWGDASASHTKTEAGQTVTVTAAPKVGYSAAVSAATAQGQAIDLTPVKGQNNQYTFVMPEGNVEITVSFAPQAANVTSVIPRYSSVRITWAGSADAASYELQRGETPDGDFKTLLAFPASEFRAEYVDETAGVGTQHYYRLSVKDKDGNLTQTNPVQADAPTGMSALRATAVVQRVYDGENQVFDGTRVEALSQAEVDALRDMSSGTVITRAQYTGSATETASILGTNLSDFFVGLNKKQMRFSFGGGNKATVSNAFYQDGTYHTSLHAYGSGTSNSLMDDGFFTFQSATPVFFSAAGKSLNSVSIGGNLANGAQSQQFEGKIAFVLVTGEVLSVAEMKAISKVNFGPDGMTNVVVTPNSATVQPGDTKAFAAVVDTQGADKTVIWTVEEAQSKQTVIDQNGVLTIGTDEKAATLIVRATLSHDTSISGQATVAVYHYTGSSGPSGTSSGQPFVAADTGSTYFRIPSMLTLNNGWLLAASDIRWRTTGDSPQNLDTIVSLSKDGGETWDWEVINYFDDYANDQTSQASASFIDPAMIQGGDGTVYMVVDACPSYCGLMSGNKLGWKSSGFDANGNLLVTKAEAGGDAPTSPDKYTYYVDYAAQRTFTIDGESVALYPIKDAQNNETGTWVDAWLDLYTVNETSVSRNITIQMGSGEGIQNNLFYRESQWKAYPTFFIMLRTGSVTEDGISWNPPKFLDIKLAENEAFTGVCPGRGIVTQVDGRERIIFPLYDNQTGTELASVIYSDDGGATWQRGSHANVLNGSGKSSESQIVTLPDGSLRMYSRNTARYISYADSTDGGETWGTYTLDQELSYCGNCMVSFINYSGTLADLGLTKGFEAYANQPLLIAAYPSSTSGRANGMIRVGAVGENNQVTWLSSYQVNLAYFAYSCLTELDNGDIGLLYEHSAGAITLESFTMDTLLQSDPLPVSIPGYTAYIGELSGMNTEKNYIIVYRLGDTLYGLYPGNTSDSAGGLAHPEAFTKEIDVENGTILMGDGSTQDIRALNHKLSGSGQNYTVQASNDDGWYLDLVDTMYHGNSGSELTFSKSGESAFTLKSSKRTLGFHDPIDDPTYGMGFWGPNSGSAAVWLYTENEPEITLNAPQTELDVGDTLTLSAQVTEAAVEDLVWTTDDAEILTVSGTGAQATVQAVAAGKASVIASVTYKGRTFSESMKFYVSDENTITIPDQYEDAMEAVATGELAYLRDGSGVVSDSAYAIVWPGCEGQLPRVLYHTGTGATDQVDLSLSNGERIATLNGKFPDSRQLWTIAQAGDGYTLQSVDSGRYLSITGATTSKMNTSEQASALRIAPSDGGAYTIGADVDGTMYYVHHANSNVQFNADTTATDLLLFRQVETVDGNVYSTAQEGLKTLLSDLQEKDLKESDYTSSSWSAYSGALAAAEALVQEGVLVTAVKADAEAGQAAVNAATKTLYAALKGLEVYSGGGGSGGGGSSSGGGSSVDVSGSTTTATVPVRPSVSNGIAQATISDSSITSAIDKVVKQAAANGTEAALEIKVAAAGTVGGVQVNLSAKALSAIEESGIQQLVLSSSIGSLTLDRAAITAIAGGSSGSDLVISIERKDGEDLSEAQQNATGGAPVFDIAIASGDQTVTSFGGGELTVALPYQLAQGQVAAGVVVRYLDESGKLTAMETRYENGFAIFTTGHLSLYVVAYDQARTWDCPFTDVSVNDWFYGAVYYASTNNLFSGTSEQSFSPNMPMTRAMLVTVLWNLAGRPAAQNSSFTDVPAGEWYTEAVAWAAGNGVVSGMTADRFEPNSSVTREQIAVILNRYAQKQGMTVTASAAGGDFSDADSISSWAADSVNWAVQCGLITGRGDGILAPGATASRAEVAAILQQFTASAQ